MTRRGDAPLSSAGHSRVVRSTARLSLDVPRRSHDSMPCLALSSAMRSPIFPSNSSGSSCFTCARKSSSGSLKLMNIALWFRIVWSSIRSEVQGSSGKDARCPSVRRGGLPFSLLALVCAELLSARSQAQTTDDQQAGARAAATAGAQAFAEKRWRESLDLFTRAESVIRSPVHELYLARTHERPCQRTGRSTGSLYPDRERAGPAECTRSVARRERPLR